MAHSEIGLILPLAIAMGGMAGLRNPSKSRHHLRVSRLASALAAEMKLPESMVEGLAVAGAVHDIGEVVIPEDILLRPTRLSYVELLLLKTHPRAGWELLKEVPFPWDIGDMVLCHHERSDGSGYPSGLKGEEIPLGARILTVADVAEAMMSDRSYRSAFPVAYVLTELEEGSGKIYDPTAVAAVLRLFREKGFSYGD